MRLAVPAHPLGLALLLPFLLAASALSRQDPAQIEAWIREGEQHLRARKHDEARQMFERARDAAAVLKAEVLETQAQCALGDAQMQLTKYAEAQATLERCLQNAERLNLTRAVARGSFLLSVTLGFMGQPAEGLPYAKRALAAFEQLGDRPGRATATLQVARLDRTPGADPKPLYDRVIEDARATGDLALEGRALHAWGDSLFGRGRYEDAFATLQDAMRAFEAAGATTELGTVHNSLGRLYRVHGRFDEALKSQLKALELHQAANAPFELLQSLNAVGAVYTTMGDLRALEYQEKALALSEHTSSPLIQDFVRGNVASLLMQKGEYARAASMLEAVIARGLDIYPSVRYSRLAQARLGMGQADGALDAAEKAIATCRPGTNECVGARQIRAVALMAAARNAEALQDLRAALATIEEIRTKLVPADFLRQNFHSAQEETYSHTIALQVRHKQNRDALETAEQARGRAFLDLLASRDVRLPPTPAGASDVVSTARRLNSTFLMYWVGEDALFAWVVTPDGRTIVQRTPVRRSRLAELVRATSGEQRWKSDIAPWRQLYELLIAPIRSALPAGGGALVTVVPHGPLLNLSFAALKDRRGRYLLEDYTLHYVPAAAVLGFTGGRAQPAARSGPALIVADPQLPSRSALHAPLQRLPGARDEGRTIAGMLPPARRTMLQDSAATESGVRLAVAHKPILHFATHAVLRDDDAFASFLALAASKGEADDGRLTAAEIYRLELNADLVVLSACKSGNGMVTGDGIATFARAFIYAGTPSLVVSLWDVADEPSNRLVPAFYRSWLNGATKASALRSAQLRLLRDLRAKAVEVRTPAGPVLVPEHPVFWAGFALIGEPK